MNNKYPKAFLLSVALTGFFFCLITFLFNALGILGLPVAFSLLQFIIPTLALLLYRFLNNRFPNNQFDKFSLTISNIILGICIAMLFFGYLKWYTLVTFLVLFVLLLYVEYKNKLRFMYRFYRTYIALLIPIYLLSLWIKTQTQVMFDPNATLKLDMGYLPIEVYFYFMGMLLMTVYLFEFFKSKGLKTRG